MAKRDQRPIRYEVQATARMLQRGISEEQLEQTLRHPQRREAADRFRERLERLRFPLTPQQGRLIVISPEDLVLA
jgi:hypothetical protein